MYARAREAVDEFRSMYARARAKGRLIERDFLRSTRVARTRGCARRADT